jgi:hypothetical protein
MFARDEKNLKKTLVSEMTRFRDYFIYIECDAKNRVSTREATVSTIVNALIGKIKWREEAHRPAKVP